MYEECVRVASIEIKTYFLSYYQYSRFVLGNGVSIFNRSLKQQLGQLMIHHGVTLVLIIILTLTLTLTQTALNLNPNPPT